jgi:hypothetical protein
MDKPFLLIAGDHYYPSRGSEDWIARFETVSEAREQIEYVDCPKFFKSGPMKGQLKSNNITYRIKCSKDPDREYDWYEIVDVRDIENR